VTVPPILYDSKTKGASNATQSAQPWSANEDMIQPPACGRIPHIHRECLSPKHKYLPDFHPTPPHPTPVTVSVFCLSIWLISTIPLSSKTISVRVFHRIVLGRGQSLQLVFGSGINKALARHAWNFYVSSRHCLFLSLFRMISFLIFFPDSAGSSSSLSIMS
jgi:hypothetical protein